MKNDSLSLEKLLGNSSDLRIILNYIKSTKRFDITWLEVLSTNKKEKKKKKNDKQTWIDKMHY